MNQYMKFRGSALTVTLLYQFEGFQLSVSIPEPSLNISITSIYTDSTEHELAIIQAFTSSTDLDDFLTWLQAYLILFPEINISDPLYGWVNIL